MRNARAISAIEQSRAAVRESTYLRQRSAALVQQSARLLETARALRLRYDCYGCEADPDTHHPASMATAEPPPEPIAETNDPVLLEPEAPDPDFQDMLIYDRPQIFCALARVLCLHGRSAHYSISVSAIGPTALPAVQRVEFLIEVPEEELGNRREYEIWVDDYELIFRIMPPLPG